MVNLQESFPRRLRALRVYRGMTRPALAEATGLQLNTIANYERGTTTPSINRALLLAEVLDCSMDLLLGREPLVNGRQKEVSS